MPKETSAGAIIFRKEDSVIYYLLLHYKSGHWDFPKGHIEEGEKEEDTVKREVAEETGIKNIKIIEGFKERIKYFFRENYNSKENKEKGRKEWIFKTVTFYLAQTQTKEVKISFEHKGFKWLRYEEALKQLTFKNAKEILKKANDRLISKKDL
ncbi:MAG: diadenosine tetraphosphate hydrolase [Candidatus Nealsonbacteria bacterium CG10_big_fil_rev_8_21_14_0_10_36_24]|uniref:Bis(5'-nucleosyl)-tetraphosphatase [asymmetrical] n=2 Tax=Candidatus Nealsoniibacteriota TaxID=1817911 RepID=A0A2H0YQZ3_9BACT|nr:MAG: diadenosine tetraphosphate hydrolase [Candidatus Nealsonbacteria bacterium CG10_big_fil_rev_8_21_14_0_10_36_24]PIS40173.1 MAG: diadenosine tetraphosphate hydrolase [Candidatus Nealsonbacteria bacterium CG08_land_8_20_14_0_20_36_22]